MTRFAARSISLLALVGLVLAATAASSGGAANPQSARIFGVVPHSNQAAAFLTPHLSSAAVTPGSPAEFTFDAGYETLIDRYLTDVAHDSGGSGNVYSAGTQYTDGSGPVQYQSTFGGSYVDHSPLPASGCDDGLDPVCLSDAQLQTEIQHALTANGWHGGGREMFFLLTPNGVGSCFDGLGTQCSTNAFCAYHSDFTDSNGERVIYANEPYEATIDGCSSDSSPNNDDADSTINTISHEHNEAITDPFGDAWLSNDAVEDEDGDLCAWTFGAPLGSGSTEYNQVINGHHYWLQEEYSNSDRKVVAPVENGCVQQLGGPASPVAEGSGPLVWHGGAVMHTNTTHTIYWLPVPGNTGLPTISGTAAVKHTLTSDAGSWTAAPTGYTYQWQRCSSSSAGCVDIPGATGSKYTLTSADGGRYVRSAVAARNPNGSAPSVVSAGQHVVSSPLARKAPHISGRAKVGRRLTASKGSWSGPPQRYSFHWFRCNAGGGSCVAIKRATRSAYALTKRDAGHRLRVRVTALNAAGKRTATSGATARVPAARR